VDDNYDVSKQLLGVAATAFDECVESIRAREQELGKDVEGAVSRARRFKGKESEMKSKRKSSGDNRIPSDYVL
jgi:hypothetical protein